MVRQMDDACNTFAKLQLNSSRIAKQAIASGLQDSLFYAPCGQEALSTRWRIQDLPIGELSRAHAGGGDLCGGGIAGTGLNIDANGLVRCDGHRGKRLTARKAELAERRKKLRFASWADYNVWSCTAEPIRERCVAHAVALGVVGAVQPCDAQGDINPIARGYAEDKILE